MKLIKKIFFGAALALSLASAQASPISVDGVVWDPDAPLDFTSASLAIRQLINTSGVLSGFGVINSINGNANVNDFCPGCQLTFVFDGYTPVTSGAFPTTPGLVVGYTGGAIKVYVNHDSTTFVSYGDASTYNALAFSPVGKDLFLDLTGHLNGSTTFNGSAIGSGSTVSFLLGFGLLDVIGGDAAGNFNTNSRENGADLSFSSSFTDITSVLDANGTGNFAGATVPEPGSLALAGIALFVAGLARRRKA